MKLTVQERLGLLELLPREGKYAALKEYRRAREVIAINPEEMKAINFKEIPMQHGATVTWDADKETVRDIPLTEFIMDTVRDLLIKQDKEKHLTEQTFTLYEKFVEAYRSTEVAH